LTLSAYNSELSNMPFERKQQIYSASHLSLNKDLVAHPRWGRGEILARAAELADRAISIWPAPVAGVGEEAIGFDWARMHAAIAAIQMAVGRPTQTWPRSPGRPPKPWVTT